ncbi:hypothetical protein GS563_28425 [Rhodococcus hoagii]|nr:hypothetical protein [Prescottella equi]
MNLAIESSGTPTDELFNNLSNILSTVAWAGMALGFLIMVVSAGRLAFAYDSYARSSALRGIIGGVGAIIGFGLAALLGAAGSASDTPAEPESEPSPAPQPDPIPTPAPEPTPTDVGDSTPAASFDINPMILLAAIGAIGFLIVTWFAVSNLRARRAERREEREARERDWATGQAVYKGVLDDYSAYLLDPFAWLQRPILEDVDEPQTAAFLEALAHTQALDLDIVPPTKTESTSSAPRPTNSGQPGTRPTRTPAASAPASTSGPAATSSARPPTHSAPPSTLPPPRPSAKPPPRPSRS